MSSIYKRAPDTHHPTFAIDPQIIRRNSYVEHEINTIEP